MPHLINLFNKKEITDSWPSRLDYNNLSDLYFSLKSYLSLSQFLAPHSPIPLSYHYIFSFLLWIKLILTTLTNQTLFLSAQLLNPYSQALIHTYPNNLSPIPKIIQWFNYYNN